MLKGADIVLRCLRAEGVELVFGYPGGAIMPLYDALEGSGVRHILTRHEQGAVFAAEGYARVTGEVGVAMATSVARNRLAKRRCAARSRGSTAVMPALSPEATMIQPISP